MQAQIHGHDFAALALLPGSAPDDPPRYASASEEKVIRVLEAPAAFEATLALARGRSLPPPQPADVPKVLVTGFITIALLSAPVSGPCRGGCVLAAAECRRVHCWLPGANTGCCMSGRNLARSARWGPP